MGGLPYNHAHPTKGAESEWAASRLSTPSNGGWTVSGPASNGWVRVGVGGLSSGPASPRCWCLSRGPEERAPVRPRFQWAGFHPTPPLPPLIGGWRESGRTHVRPRPHPALTVGRPVALSHVVVRASVAALVVAAAASVAMVAVGCISEVGRSRSELGEARRLAELGPPLAASLALDRQAVAHSRWEPGEKGWGGVCAAQRGRAAPAGTGKPGQEAGSRHPGPLLGSPPPMGIRIAVPGGRAPRGCPCSRSGRARVATPAGPGKAGGRRQEAGGRSPPAAQRQ